MPKTKMNYNNTIIYRIVCNDLSITDCYVGHTTSFGKRKTRHKYNCIHDYSDFAHLNVYTFINENGGWDNWSMIEIEKFPCDDKREAMKRERFWLEKLKATLNIRVPTRSRKENLIKRAEHYASVGKKWREANREKELKRQKQYYQDNKDKTRKTYKEYREKNHQMITEKARRRFACECGSEISWCGKKRHLGSVKHKLWVSENPQ